MNLQYLVADADRLIARAAALQDEMSAWLDGVHKPQQKFDGSFGVLIDLYETDPESPYRNLKPGIAHSYGVYLRRLRGHIGKLMINDCDGRDARRWFAKWRLDDSGRERLPRARFVLAVLKAVLSFGITARYPGCTDFKLILKELEFPTVPSRTFAPSAEQIIALRKAAHANGAPERALLYALQFEATLRQWDVIGQWIPMSDKKPSAITFGAKKWIGPTWAAIDKNLILKVKPTKTERTTEVEVTYDLSACPMVMEEIAKILPDERKGPLIVRAVTGRPYVWQAFNQGWRADAKAAGIPPGMWNRDLRAGGVTEGGKAGASKDDRRKLAGHAREETTEIYDRDQLEAHRRVMQSRTAFRNKNAS